MQWIILLLITLVLVVLRGFFGRQYNQNRWKQNKAQQKYNQKEVVVPRQHRLANDLEASEEIGFEHLSSKPPHSTGNHEEDEESLPLEELRPVISREPLDGLHLHQRAEKYHRSALITPLHPAKAHSRRVEPLWEIYGFADITEETEEEEGTEMEGLIDTIDQEFAVETGTVGLSETVPGLLRTLEPDQPANHRIQIGLTPAPVPAHEMPIYLTVSPSLTALAKDPYWAFIYWVLPDQVPTGQWELRVQNLTDQSEFFEKVDVEARRWYLHLNQPEHNFTFELGVRDEYGYFHPVLCSGQIKMPPDRPSDQIDADWLTIDELYKGHDGALRPQGSAAFQLELGGASEMLQHKQ